MENLLPWVLLSTTWIPVEIQAGGITETDDQRFEAKLFISPGRVDGPHYLCCSQ